MADLKDLIQSADWKTEKHVPVIDAPGSVKKGDSLNLTVTVGKEVPHPNKAEHHIRWVAVFFQPEGDKFPYQVGRAEFAAHGESAKGADTSTIYTNPSVALSFKTDKPGILYASSYCNIHGLWQSSKEIKVSG